MRTRFTIGRALYTAGGLDEDNYSTAPGWSDTIEPIEVYGWQPLASDMPIGSEFTHRVITSKLLLVPDVSPWHPSDKVWLSGTVTAGVFIPANPADVFYVSEDVRDFNTGPFGFKPGGAVVISRTQG